MGERSIKVLLAMGMILLPVVCYITGRASSPFRFSYPLLLLMLTSRVAPLWIIWSGVAFSLSYVVMALAGGNAADQPLNVAAELFFYLLSALAAAAVAKSTARERNQFRLAETTFQGLSSELSTKTMNLQATLDALSLANTKLQNLDRNKTAFLGNLAHELRTPLSGIRSYSEILLTYDDLDTDTQREFLGIIQEESIRLTTLLNDLLNLVKFETGNMDLAPGKTNAVELIEECLRIMKPMAAAKSLNLIAEIPPAGILVKSDSGQIKQVLINLVNNAIKFSNQGGITVGVVAREHCAEFFVADSGEGIFPEEQEKIFDQFYRVLDNIPNRPSGTGLGLSICKKIVGLHGGEIWVESSIGKGSTFRFTIPLFADNEYQQSLEVEKKRINRPEEFRPILVVVKNTIKRMCLRKSLEKVGYKTFGAASYEKGYLFAKSSPIDLIVAEVCSGTEDIEQLISLANRDGIPFYLCHFHAEPPEMIQLAIYGYLWLPLDRFQFLSLLEPLKMQSKKVFIISPDMSESRMLQMLLGAEGYATSLSGDNDKFIPTCVSYDPEAIIIGSFEEDHLDGIIRKIRIVEPLANLPLILVLKGKPHGNTKLITLPPLGERSLLFGLSPLVQKIEVELGE